MVCGMKITTVQLEVQSNAIKNRRERKKKIRQLQQRYEVAIAAKGYYGSKVSLKYTSNGKTNDKKRITRSQNNANYLIMKDQSIVISLHQYLIN